MSDYRRWFPLFALFVAFALILPVATPASASPVEQTVQLGASDGRTVPALVTYPDGGPDSGAPVAIFHHGGPGGHPLRALSASRWAARYFAERGYITISILSRISRDLIDQPFGAGVADIAGAVDWASQLSSGPIVLVGHSSGSISSTLYMAQTNDARVKAIVHFAPTAAGPEWMARSMGEERYRSVVAQMQALVAQGQSDRPVYEDHRLAPPAPQNITYGYLMSASTWLSWWGPDSRNRNIRLFPQIRVPMLMISGDADIFVSRAYQEELRTAASASPRVDSIILDGGVSHEFTGSEARAAALAVDWLSHIGVRASPRIATRLVDLQIGASRRSGIIYEPVDPALRKPMAVLLLPDFADDVLLTPLDTIAPRLARAGYTILVPQDVGSGWGHYRAVRDAVSVEQRSWLTYLTDQGHARTAVIAHGWAGTLVPALVSPSPLGPVAGVALIQPPPAPADFAIDALGRVEYDRAVDQAEAAVARNEGGTTMIIAQYRAVGEAVAPRQWIIGMASGFLSFWGPSAPTAPIAALAANDQPVMLVDAGEGRFLRREVQSRPASGEQISSLWYDGHASPFEAPDRLATDIAAWLDMLVPHPDVPNAVAEH